LKGRLIEKNKNVQRGKKQEEGGLKKKKNTEKKPRPSNPKKKKMVVRAHTRAQWGERACEGKRTTGNIRGGANTTIERYHLGKRRGTLRGRKDGGRTDSQVAQEKLTLPWVAGSANKKVWVLGGVEVKQNLGHKKRSGCKKGKETMGKKER